jgi:hypothetical protein
MIAPRPRFGFIALLLVAALALVVGCQRGAPEGKADAGEPMVSRADLFDPQERIRMRLSPDGSQIAWLEGREGAYQIVMARRDALDAPHALTPDDLAVSNYFFAPNGTHITFVADYRSHSIAIATGEITPIDYVVADAMVTPVAFSVDHPDEAVFMALDRQWNRVGVARANVVTGISSPMALDLENINGVVFDRALEPRLGYRARPDGRVDLLTLEAGQWVRIDTLSEEEASRFDAIGFDGANDRMFILDGRDLNEKGLKLLDLTTGETELVAGISTAPVTDALISPLTGELDAMLIGGDRNEWLALTPIGFSAFDLIRTEGLDRVKVLSRSMDDRFWIVITISSSRPNRYFLLDIRERRARPLLELWPALAKLPDQRVVRLSIDVGNGAALEGALFMPHDAILDENGLPQNPIPLVVSQERFEWFTTDHDFEPIIPWLNSRGYGFLAVAPRLESLNNPDEARRRLTRLGQWLIDQGIADTQGAILAGDQWRGTLVLDLMSDPSTPFRGGVAISPLLDAADLPLAHQPGLLARPVMIGLDDFAAERATESALTLAQNAVAAPIIVLKNDEIANSIVNNKAFLAAFEVFGHDLTGAKMEAVTTLKGRESVTVLHGGDYFTALEIKIEE